MPDQIIRRDLLEQQLDNAFKTMDRDTAILDVAGRTGLDPIALESVLAARESQRSSMEQGA